MDRVGEVNINNQGLKMTIIEYINSKDISVQFEDGIIVKHKRNVIMTLKKVEKEEDVKLREGITGRLCLLCA